VERAKVSKKVSGGSARGQTRGKPVAPAPSVPKGAVLDNELQVAREELEVQNEELRVLQDELTNRNQQLRSAVERYTDLYDHAPSAYFTVEMLDGKIIEANLTASDLLGVSRNVIRKSRFARFIEPEFADSFYLFARKTLEAPGKQTCEIKMRRWDGSVFWALLDMLSASESNQIRISATDITDRKKAEQIKDEFIGMVSHELRTPLTIILGSIEVARSERTSPGELKDLLGEAASSSENLALILDNLIELSRYQSGRLKLNMVPADIGHILRNITESEAGRLKGHRLSLRIDGNLSEVKIDRLRLQRVLHNLLDNAAKYSPAGSEIVVSAKPQGESVLVGVRNHGEGIPPEDQAKLFEPFERLKEEPTTTPGLGLGLLVCRRLVEAHGGKIWVESKPGLGSTFWFTLPLAH